MTGRDRTYRIQIVGEQTGDVHQIAHGIPHDRLQEVAALVKEQGPRVAAAVRASRAATEAAGAMGDLLDAFGLGQKKRAPARRRGAR